MSSSPREQETHPTEHVQGIVERVTYHAEDSGYTVAQLKAPGYRDLVTIVSRFPDIHAGQSLRLTGYWIKGIGPVTFRCCSRRGL